MGDAALDPTATTTVTEETAPAPIIAAESPAVPVEPSAAVLAPEDSTTSAESVAVPAKVEGEPHAATDTGPAAPPAPYALPKFVVTPVEMSGEDEVETAPKPGHRHATAQTLITSAPALRTRPDSETTLVDDPAVAESVTVIRRYQRVLRRVFDHYAAAGGAVLDQGAFLTLCKEFAVVPALIEPDDLAAVFRAVRAPALSFRDLIAVLTRLALTVYRHDRRMDAAEQKLSALFRAMQLDQKDIVLHRLRKTRPPTSAATAAAAADIDFDQKDLDLEIDRILESMATPDAPPLPSDAGTGRDMIGPLAAQVQATLDQVRQYTTERSSRARRPSNLGLGRRAGPPAAAAMASSSYADPFLRPIVPPGPVTTLPPLYYPGVTSAMRRASVAAAAAAEPATPSTWRSDESAPVSAKKPPSPPPKAAADPAKRRRPGPVVVPTPPERHKESGQRGPKPKGRIVGEATREKAAQVTVAEKHSERDMQRRHMGQLDRRRSQQMQRLGRHVPAQFAGGYAAAS